jgi:hypothetical protein
VTDETQAAIVETLLSGGEMATCNYCGRTLPVRQHVTRDDAGQKHSVRWCYNAMKWGCWDVVECTRTSIAKNNDRRRAG